MKYPDFVLTAHQATTKNGVVMRLVVFAAFLASLGSLFAQEITNDTTLLPADSLLTEEVEDPVTLVPWSIYIEYLPEYAPHLDEYGFNQQIGIGGSYKSLQAGFFINYLRNGITRRLIFPNQFDLLFLHNGVFAGVSLFSKERLSVAIRHSFSLGSLVWENTETKEDLVRDYFFMSKPELNVQYTLAPVLAIYGSIGYKIGHEIEIPGLEQDNLDGLAIGIGIRAGFFRSGL